MGIEDIELYTNKIKLFHYQKLSEELSFHGINFFPLIPVSVKHGFSKFRFLIQYLNWKDHLTKKTQFSLSIIFLLLTVPWFGLFFTGQSLFGFPIWAIYSLWMGLVYCIVIAWIIEKYWHITALNKSDDQK